MRKVGLLYHPGLVQAQRLAAEIELALRDLRAAAWIASSGDEARTMEQVEGSDCVITFGGDGTIIRAARLLASWQVPILGVNMGRVGFLAETEPREVVSLLPQVVRREYRIEERAMLRVVASNAPPADTDREAVNDVVVGRRGIGRLVRVAAYVDDEYLTTYVADGVIVATATGSTAYALAAGGPILAPELEDILLVPIASHLSMDRALVLPPEGRVRLEIARPGDAALTIDGQVSRTLEAGESVVVEEAPIGLASFASIRPLISIRCCCTSFIGLNDVRRNDALLEP